MKNVKRMNVGKKQLEIVLSKLRVPDKPKEGLEQYSTPSSLAAQVLNYAALKGDIVGKTVFDFGCGTGRLAIGAALMGAERVMGVDIDEDSLAIAEENAGSVGADVSFVNVDIKEFEGSCDTVLQNPPFGMRGQKRSDRPFLRKALESGKRIYSIHRGGYRSGKEGDGNDSDKTRDFVTKFVEENGGHVVEVTEHEFYIPHMFEFHKKPRVRYNVDLFLIERDLIEKDRMKDEI